MAENVLGKKEIVTIRLIKENIGRKRLKKRWGCVRKRYEDGGVSEDVGDTVKRKCKTKVAKWN